jgi:hypothetical protein
MRRFFTSLTLVAVAVAALTSASYASKKGTSYVLVNDDNAGAANTVSVYTISGNTLTYEGVISTGGEGLGGGYFGLPRIQVAHSLKYGNCAYAADADTGDIAGINLDTLTVTGNFHGGSGDSGELYGIGLTAKVNYLYANFTASETIATFTEQAGCILKYKSSFGPVAGLNGGIIDGWDAHLGRLVATFADGSIGSWNVSAGVPSPQGEPTDLQLSTGYSANEGIPVAADISLDGKYAIFADINEEGTTVELEVSAIGSNGLGATVNYTGLGTCDTGECYNQVVRFSPDMTLAYTSSDVSGLLTAVYFDASTGVLSGGCTSGEFKNFETDYFYAAGLSTQSTGTGSNVYVSESGGAQGFNATAIIDVTSSKHANGKSSCTLAEDPSSPAVDNNSTGFALSNAASPARPF